MPYEALLSALILVTSLLVLFDAKGLGARRGGIGGGQLDMGYVAWFVACLLLWIIAFPCYLVARPRLVWAEARREARSPVVPAAPVHHAQPYSREYAQAYGLPWTEPFVQPGPALPPAAPKASSSRGVQLAGLAAIVAAIALAVPAIADFERAHPDAYGTPAAAPAAAPVAAPSSHSPTIDETLARITLHTSDFHDGYRVALIPGGDRVAGQVTLDNCAHHFVTESARVARRQVEVLDSNGKGTNVTNEVVAYRTSASADAALREWYTAAAHCPHKPIRIDGVTGKIQVSTNTTHVPGLPNPTNVVTVERLTVKGAGSFYLIGVLQVRGRILDAVYVNARRAPTDRELRGVRLVSAGTGARLANQ